MTKTEMRLDFERRFKQFSRKRQQEVDQEITRMWSKFALWGVGGVGVLGFIAGKMMK